MYERIVRPRSGTNGPRWMLAAALTALWLVLTAGAALAARSPDGLWNEVGSLTNPTSGITFQNLNLPSDYRIYELDMVGLQQLLSGAGEPSSGPRRGSASLTGPSGVVVLTIPMPDGSFARFRIQESSILSVALQTQHPELSTIAPRRCGSTSPPPDSTPR